MTTSRRDVEGCQNPGCAGCKNKRPFTLPNELVEALVNENLVIFAGAGVSTEAAGVYNETLYQDVAYEIGLSSADLSFAELMSRFCARPNGRAQLLRKIRKRFDYLKSFPEVYRKATSFHRELATIPYLHEIFSTNWDDLFEQECAATPIVTAEDFVFWNVPERKVFKLHGSINNYGSLVATNEDYEQCYERLQSGLVGSRLKLALATKVVLFVGYSLHDHDFVRIYELVKQEMGELIPHAYIVTLDGEGADRYQTLGLTPIVTDATFFLETLKERLISDQLMLSDDWQLYAFEALQQIRSEHEKLESNFDCLDNPAVVYAAFYQDGLIHAFEHMLSIANTGRYSKLCGAKHHLEPYRNIRKEKLRSRAYSDVAYIDGYMNGLTYPFVSGEVQSLMPLYYVFGYKEDILTIDEYSSVVIDAKQLHKSSFKHATDLVRTKLPPNAERMILHHNPFL